MDTTPKPCNEEQLIPYAQKFKAIGHPVRLKILCLIVHQEVPCVGDIWRCLDQPQPVVSQHLAILKRYGIVSSEVKKTRRIYSISDPFIKNLIDSMICEMAPALRSQKNSSVTSIFPLPGHRAPRQMLCLLLLSRSAGQYRHA